MAAWAARRRTLCRVDGDSMRPTFRPGDCVLVKPAVAAGLRPMDLVVVRDPSDDRRLWVKRVGSLGTGTFAVVSDNPLEARDSRHVGSLRAEHLVGVPTLIIPTEGRVRRLRRNAGARG